MVRSCVESSQMPQQRQCQSTLRKDQFMRANFDNEIANVEAERMEVIYLTQSANKMQLRMHEDT